MKKLTTIALVAQWIEQWISNQNISLYIPTLRYTKHDKRLAISEPTFGAGRVICA
jgi:hypothetical protein